MILPDELRQIIEVAYSSVLEHPQQDLTLGYRHAIWAAMGPRSKPSEKAAGSGWQRRANLAILSAKQVLPIWERIWPDDNAPHTTLAKAEGVLNRSINPKRANRDYGLFWTYMDNLMCQTEHKHPVMVGYSAAKALVAALFDEKFDPSSIDYGLTDADVDAYDYDAAFAASVAYANGPIWDPLSDSNKRQDYWEWWLKEAVVSSWNRVGG